MPKSSFRLLAALFATSLVVACGGATDDSANGGDDEEDLTKAGALSQGLVCATISAVNDDSDGTGLKIVKESALKGDALADFKSWQKGMVSDYPSAAYELPVKMGKKTYTFWYVVEENDGGGCTGVYRTDGRTVSTACAGESDEIVWSAPGDKCDQ